MLWWILMIKRCYCRRWLTEMHEQRWPGSTAIGVVAVDHGWLVPVCCVICWQQMCITCSDYVTELMWMLCHLFHVAGSSYFITCAQPCCAGNLHAVPEAWLALYFPMRISLLQLGSSRKTVVCVCVIDCVAVGATWISSSWSLCVLIPACSRMVIGHH